MNRKVNRVKLALLPTPIHELPRLAKELGKSRLFIKRDDLTGLAGGGNKVRKLEYLTADAKHKNADVLITTGAVQSNHCRQTSGAASKLGFDCLLVLVTDENTNQFAEDSSLSLSGNLLLDEIMGAKTFFCSVEERDETMNILFEEEQRKGRNPYIIPYGGSNELGVWAYVQAMHEIINQGVEPDWIIVASSSGGTQAGLMLGAELYGFKGKILGISVDQSQEQLEDQIFELVMRTTNFIGKTSSITKKDISIIDQYATPGYGVFTEIEALGIDMFAKTEGILVDPVYTGRAGGGMIDLFKSGYFDKDDLVLFWHTGGIPALFAEQYNQYLSR